MDPRDLNTPKETAKPPAPTSLANQLGDRLAKVETQLQQMQNRLDQLERGAGPAPTSPTYEPPSKGKGK